ncbi:site-specific integrase [Acinetobacter towneri]|uniref:site-specific integrase n=1 Tax=Acinetobacter towneri TaxID=202956 RepID=UPI002577C67B|nr:site-specific integrase [Acinetobacter towneri]MDM1487424.1 site-specific integrase [Acinetobacter towneri]
MQQDLFSNDNGWREIPDFIVSREGKKVNTTGDLWNLPYAIDTSSSKLDFSKFENENLKWVLKSFIIEKIEKVSTHAGLQHFQDIWAKFFRTNLEIINSAQDIEETLIAVVENAINLGRSEHKLWTLYRPIQWYLYGAEHYPELGFSTPYAQILETMSIPGNPKGEAVRMEDPDTGPLNHTLELPLLIHALKKDQSNEFIHLQEKAAIALSIAYGRNPANLTYLRHSDLVNLASESDEPVYVLRMPRIKKRLVNPRDDYIEEFLDSTFAKYICDLTQANNETNAVLYHEGKKLPNSQPIFLNINGNEAAILSGDYENAYNFSSSMITSLIKGFVRRHNIISPLTKELMCVTARRLRYTLATGLAAEGISKAALARILDHTDTQHVHVYFELAGKIVIQLDKAIAKGFSQYLSYFSGHIIDSSEDAMNGDKPEKHLVFKGDRIEDEIKDIGVCGESSICHLDPPFSCYLCPKFQPYRHADHEYVLESLLNSRNERLEKYENARLGIQLDEVIFAVAQVAEACKKEDV